MSRGRRLELGGFGAFGGAFFGQFSPWIGIGYGLALICVGCLLQIRVERSRTFPPGRVEISKDGEPLEGREREEMLREYIGLLAWEAAGRPGLPNDEDTA